MRSRLDISVEAGRLVASLRSRTAVVWAAGCPAATPDELQAGLREMLSLETIRRARPVVQVRIGSPVIQCRLLHDLPKVGRQDLVSLVARHSGRYFRKNGIPLVTSARWAPRVSTYGCPSAIAAAVEESWITAIEASLTECGCDQAHVTPAEQPDLMLRSAKALARRAQSEHRLSRRLVAACGLIWLVAAGVLVLRQELDLRWLREEQARMAAPATAVSQARRRLHDAMRSVSAIREHGDHRAAALSSLVAVLNALPDTAYLQAFQWTSDGRGSVSGAGPDAADVLAQLEQRAMLPEPRMQGVAAADVADGVRREHFTIRFGEAER